MYDKKDYEQTASSQWTIDLCQQMADELDKCCGKLDDGSPFSYADKILTLFQSEKWKSCLTYLRHYSGFNAVEIKRINVIIEKYAIEIDNEIQRLLKTHTLSQDPLELLNKSIFLWHKVPELAAELRRIAKLLREDQKPTEQKDTPAKRWGIWTCIKRIPHWIYYILGALAALLTILHLLGLLEPIKAFIGKILWPK